MVFGFERDRQGRQYCPEYAQKKTGKMKVNQNQNNGGANEDTAEKQAEAENRQVEAEKKQAEAAKMARKAAQKLRKLQKALRLDDKMFRRVLDGLDTGVAFHDLVTGEDGVAVDYTVREVNPAYEELVGLTVDETVGKRASEIFGRGRAPIAPFLNRISETLKGGEIRSFDGSLRTTKAKLRVSVVPMGGKLFALMIHDISDSMRAESRVRARRTFLENKVKALALENTATEAKLAEARSQIAAQSKQMQALKVEQNSLNKQLKTLQSTLIKGHGMFEKVLQQLAQGLPK